jgi:2'-5' RNA ligase
VTRYFIALLPPENVQDAVTRIQQQFADCYASHKALNSPPHITLQPPFEQTNTSVLGQADLSALARSLGVSSGGSTHPIATLEQFLANFAAEHQPVPIQLSGFAAFAPRVIYINVLKTPELLALQAALLEKLERQLGIVQPTAKNRPFAPHITVAFRDLTPENFQAGWAKFQHQLFQYEFTVPALTLLVHRDRRWLISANFAFGNCSALSISQPS